MPCVYVCLRERACASVCVRAYVGVWAFVHAVVVFLCIAEVAFLSLVGWMRGGIQGLRFVIVVWIALDRLIHRKITVLRDNLLFLLSHSTSER